jgi:hypothetical protein
MRLREVRTRKPLFLHTIKAAKRSDFARTTPDKYRYAAICGSFQKTYLASLSRSRITKADGTLLSPATGRMH